MKTASQLHYPQALSLAIIGPSTRLDLRLGGSAMGPRLAIDFTGRERLELDRYQRDQLVEFLMRLPL